MVDNKSTADTTKPVRTRIARVVSDSRDKTRKVVITQSHAHPRYGKVLHREIALHIHDENNESKCGDLVRIRETRPVSKTKTWALVEIVPKA